MKRSYSSASVNRLPFDSCNTRERDEVMIPRGFRDELDAGFRLAVPPHNEKVESVRTAPKVDFGELLLPTKNTYTNNFLWNEAMKEDELCEELAALFGGTSLASRPFKKCKIHPSPTRAKRRNAICIKRDCLFPQPCLPTTDAVQTNKSDQPKF